MHDIAEFLRSHPPFDTFDEETLEQIAGRAEIEFHAARTAILDNPDAVPEHGYVVRRGAVELVIDGRTLDLIGDGEMFAFTSVLSGEPPGFVARAAEDTLVYDLAGAPSVPEARRGTVRGLTRSRRDLRAWQLWHGPGGLRSG